MFSPLVAPPPLDRSCTPPSWAMTIAPALAPHPAGAEIDAPDEEWVVERDKLAERLSLVSSSAWAARAGRCLRSGWHLPAVQPCAPAPG